MIEGYVRVVGDAPAGKLGPGGRKNLHVLVIPEDPIPAAKRAINAASFDEIVPLLLTSAVTFWLLVVRVLIAATCCAIRPASFDEILFWPVILDSETV